MKRIKLPGSNKDKKIILVLLVILCIGIIIKFGIDNRENKIKKEQINVEQQLEEKLLKDEEKKIKDNKENKLYEEISEEFFNHKYDTAIDKATKLINEFPESYKGYNIRGIAKAYSGDFQEGMKDIDYALSIKEDYGYAMFNKALNYELYEKLDDALIWYNKALDVEEYIWSYYGKASVYGRRGDVKNAVANLKNAIELAKETGDDDAVKEEAVNEKDFDSVRESNEFNELIY